jgi:glucose-6-phosphate 1-dehydrogenase
VRKLLPALYMAHLHGNLPAGARILAVGRQALSREAFIQQVLGGARQFIEARALQAEAWDRFEALIDYVALDATQAEDFARLARHSRPGAQRVFYLAGPVHPHLRPPGRRRAGGCPGPRGAGKALGHDMASARAINAEVGRFFEEHQIFRIDHYLGKETVQNLMVLRFGNAIFEPLWRAPIRSVQITVAETVGVGSRAGFYDGTGALRDMVQNHLLQMLCIVAMEPPVSLDPDAIRDEKLKVLRSLRPMGPAEIARDVIRGQYTAGTVQQRAATGYLQEDGVPPDSRTETFVSLKAHIDNWRWGNVPFFLRTGKCLAERCSEIVIDFAGQPFSLFPDTYRSAGNRLVIRLQPEESVQLQIMAKEPGSGMRRRPVSLDLDLHTAFTERRAEAYERLLIDVIRGRLTHFMRHDELEAAWAWVEPILHGWAAQGDAPGPMPPAPGARPPRRP